jgi:hypothetical protein
MPSSEIHEATLAPEIKNVFTLCKFGLDLGPHVVVVSQKMSNKNVPLLQLIMHMTIRQILDGWLYVIISVVLVAFSRQRLLCNQRQPCWRRNHHSS